MKLIQVKVKDAVTVAGHTEMTFHPKSAVMTKAKMSLEGNFVRFDYGAKEVVLVPLENVTYLVVESEENKDSKETVKPSDSLFGKGKK